MAITTRAQLEAAVANWLARGDLGARAPEFVDLGIARIRREQEWDRRVYSFENTGDGIDFTVQGMTLPIGVRTVREVWPMSGSRFKALEQTSFAGLRDMVARNQDATGEPQKFAIAPARNPLVAGPRIQFWPTPAGAYEFDLHYVHDVGGLDNDLFAYAPDLYLFAALSESAPFLKHDERVAVWEARYGRALAGVNARADADQFGSAELESRLPFAIS